jgi:dolichol-phosphate mannosyltransferase
MASELPANQGDQERSDLQAIYEQRFPEEDDTHKRWRQELWRILVDDYFSRWIEADATVLDFGCGHGEFINAVRAGRRIAVDVRETAAKYLDEGVEFVSASDVRIPSVADNSVDVIFCSNLLEHLPDRETVTRLLREFARMLSSNGRLLILGPNLRYTGSAYWDFFDHILPITDKSLIEALATADLVPEKVIPRFLPYTTVGSRLIPLALVRPYLRIPLAWRFFGAQFFAVSRQMDSRSR